MMSKTHYDIIYLGGENMDKEILEILKTMESKIDEHTQILRALEHSPAHNWADIAKLKAVK